MGKAKLDTGQNKAAPSSVVDVPPAWVLQKNLLKSPIVDPPYAVLCLAVLRNSCSRGSLTSRKLQLMLLGKLPVHGIFSLCSVIHTYTQKININLKNSCDEVAFAIKSYSIC